MLWGTVCFPGSPSDCRWAAARSSSEATIQYTLYRAKTSWLRGGMYMEMVQNWISNSLKDMPMFRQICSSTLGCVQPGAPSSTSYTSHSSLVSCRFFISKTKSRNWVPDDLIQKQGWSAALKFSWGTNSPPFPLGSSGHHFETRLHLPALTEATEVSDRLTPRSCPLVSRPCQQRRARAQSGEIASCRRHISNVLK